MGGHFRVTDRRNLDSAVASRCMDPALRPLGVGELLDASIRLMRRRFGDFVILVAITTIPVQIVTVFVLFSVLPDPNASTTSFNVSTESSATTTTGATSGGQLAALLATVVLGLLATQFATGACTTLASETHLGRVSEWKSSLGAAWKRFGSIVWVSIIYLVVPILGLFLCIAPGVWLYVAWSLAIPVLMVEGARGTKAIGRSYRLVRGRWWPIFGVVLLAQIFLGIVSSVLGVMFAIPLAIANPTSEWATAIFTVLPNALAGLVTLPFTVALYVVLYYDQRVRKEGFDIALAIQQLDLGLGVAPTPASGWQLPPAAPPWSGPSSSPGPHEPPPGWAPP